MSQVHSNYKGEWFDSANLGIIYHWGVYSAAARGEWVMNRERYTPQEYYQTYGPRFTAENWDPNQWMEDALAAGARYVILTARHHDGFCLWPSKTTSWHVGELGPNRDLVGDFITAARMYGLRVGLYYSLADWSHQSYPSGWERDWPLSWNQNNTDQQAFVEYCKAQLKELMTNYGTIDYLWYDGAFPQPLNGSQMNRMVYELQPKILLNERNGHPSDVRISEQHLGPKPSRWEAAITLNRNWGYHGSDESWKSLGDLVRSFLTVRSEGGNFLVNLGPRADGSIPNGSVSLLRDFGQWLSLCSSWFVSKSQRNLFSWNNSVFLMPGVGGVLLFILEPLAEDLRIWEFQNPIESILCPRDNRKVEFYQHSDGWFRLINPPTPENDVPVFLKIQLEGEVRVLTPRGQHWIIP